MPSPVLICPPEVGRLYACVIPNSKAIVLFEPRFFEVVGH